MTTIRFFIAAVVLSSVANMTGDAHAQPLRTYTAAERQVIRSMPIEQRPNRPGHFYGNTIRRLNRLAR